jgi:hypothetical protein
MLEHAWWKQKKMGPNLKYAVAAALFDELEIEERRAQQPTRQDDCDCGSEWRTLGKFGRI